MNLSDLPLERQIYNALLSVFEKEYLLFLRVLELNTMLVENMENKPFDHITISYYLELVKSIENSLRVRGVYKKHLLDLLISESVKFDPSNTSVDMSKKNSHQDLIDTIKTHFGFTPPSNSNPRDLVLNTLKEILSSLNKK